MRAFFNHGIRGYIRLDELQQLHVRAYKMTNILCPIADIENHFRALESPVHNHIYSMYISHKSLACVFTADSRLRLLLTQFRAALCLTRRSDDANSWMHHCISWRVVSDTNHGYFLTWKMILLAIPKASSTSARHRSDTNSKPVKACPQFQALVLTDVYNASFTHQPETIKLKQRVTTGLWKTAT